MSWNAITALAAVVSMGAYIVTALYIRAQLKALEKERYLTVTNDLYSIWQSREFMDAQLWLLHRLEAPTWEEFVQKHRADYGETAFHRVGAFYDRIGTLVRLGLVNDQEILATIGAHSIAVWQKIAPLVYEARRVENSLLFADFERLLPACYDCYVPALGQNTRVAPFSLDQAANVSASPDHRENSASPENHPAIPGSISGPPGKPAPFQSRSASTSSSPDQNDYFFNGRVSVRSRPLTAEQTGPIDRITPQALKRRVDQGELLTLLDVRQEVQVKQNPITFPGALWITPDEIENRVSELPIDREVIVSCA